MNDETLLVDSAPGRCTTCRYEEDRAPEELEPGSVCPSCGAATFGAVEPEDGTDENG